MHGSGKTITAVIFLVSTLKGGSSLNIGGESFQNFQVCTNSGTHYLLTIFSTSVLIFGGRYILLGWGAFLTFVPAGSALVYTALTVSLL